jgi:arginyl-tRNA synthetase
MLSLKHDLLAALAAELDKLLPGAAAKAAFESPKVASHGDFASTAAMQLAKPLGKNPRQVAETLREALQKTEPFTRWVESIDIAGPGFLNIRLKPEAKQQVIREVLAEATWWSLFPPTRLALCMSATADKRHWVTRSAICTKPRAGTFTASFITTMQVCKSAH